MLQCLWIPRIQSQMCQSHMVHLLHWGTLNSTNHKVEKINTNSVLYIINILVKQNKKYALFILFYKLNLHLKYIYFILFYYIFTKAFSVIVGKKYPLYKIIQITWKGNFPFVYSSSLDTFKESVSTHCEHIHRQLRLKRT